MKPQKALDENGIFLSCQVDYHENCVGEAQIYRNSPKTKCACKCHDNLAESIQQNEK